MVMDDDLQCSDATIYGLVEIQVLELLKQLKETQKHGDRKFWSETEIVYFDRYNHQ